MNLIQLLVIKLHPEPVFIDGKVNSIEVVVHSKTKSVVVPETIDAGRQLILEDGRVTYSGVETTLGISKTSIDSIFHEYLTDKKICSRWISHNFSIAQKNLCRLVERNDPKIRSLCFETCL